MRIVGAVAALTTGIALLVPIASAAPREPTIGIEPEPDNHDPAYIRRAQRIAFEGNVDPDRSSFRAYQESLGPDGQLLERLNITAVVDPDANGDFQGDYKPNYDCGDPCRPVEETVHQVQLRIEVTADGETASATSNRLTLDHDPPAITTYTLESTTRIRVDLSESVWHPNPTGDNPNDWRVDTGSDPDEACCSSEAQIPTAVEGSGAVRWLTLNSALDEDATPRVRYEPSLFAGSLAPYEDRVLWEISLPGRDQHAVDRIPPQVPDLDRIDGEEPGSEPVHGRDPTPTVHVTGVRDGHQVEIRRGSADGELLGRATAGSDGATIELSDLGDDGRYTLVAIAQDPAGNRTADDAPSDYLLDRVPPFPLGADADGETITVTFPEDIVGTNRASDWTLSSGQEVTGVRGNAHERLLDVSGTVREDVTLGWTPGDYTDRAGNPMAAFSDLDVAGGTPLPLPVITQIAGEAVVEGRVVSNDPQPAIHVVDLEPGDDVQIVRVGSDGSRTTVASATNVDGTEQTLTPTDPLDEGSHRLLAIADDGVQAPREASSEVIYRLDTTAPTPVAAVADGDQVAVHLSEEISGTDGASQWALSGCGTDCRLITDVTGTGNRRVLQANGNVQAGWTLDWTPPLTGDPYTDEAGNELTGFPIELIGDPPPLVTITGPGDVTEGTDTHAGFSVELTRASDDPVTVTWETVADTATSPGDYEGASGVLVFEPGATTQCSQGATTGPLGAVDACTVSVDLADDEVWEEAEVFHVDLTSSLGAPIDRSRGTARVLDDEATPGLRVGDAISDETDEPHRQYVVVRLAPAVDRDISFTWATDDVTATAGRDYRAASGQATIPAGNSATVLPVDILGDTEHEPDETFTVTLSNATAPAGFSKPTGTFTILNDDPPVPSLSIDDVQITEGDHGTAPAVFTVRLAPASEDEVRVDYATADASATAPRDYRSTSGTLVFRPGQTERTVAVSVVGDTVTEPDETFAVDLSNPSGAPTVDGRGVGTIVDDDRAGAGPRVVFRYAGPDRYHTAVEISRASYQDGGAPSVVLARGDDPDGYADALAGTPLAVRLQAPLLITPPEGLHPGIEDEIQRVLEPGREVVLLGGTDALSPAVEERLERLGYRTRRVFGADRMATAVEIARELGDPPTLMIARGFAFPDALAAGAAASHVGAAVLLGDDHQRNVTTERYLQAHPDTERYAIGGHMARLYPGAQPVYGPERIATAREVAETFFSAPTAVGISRNDRFPDSLAGGAHIARFGGPMLLAQPPWAEHPDGLDPLVSEYLCERAGQIVSVHLYGGVKALSAETERVVGQRIEGHGC